MEATSITDPWQGTASDANSTGGSQPLEQTVDLGAANVEPPGPIREAVDQLLAFLGLTVDDLKVLGTVGNTIGLLIAAASYAGWL